MLAQSPKLTNCSGLWRSRASCSRPAPDLLLAQAANCFQAATKASSLPAFGLQVPQV
jgi:hypothetical protein